jgi:hypothetical protein
LQELLFGDFTPFDFLQLWDGAEQADGLVNAADKVVRSPAVKAG